ncbi:MAG: hypothetical protein IJQ00_02475, partial [Kiritimatiellae bacterium]|nr:hypothetical protein [Kiritimatiellia bacterium]
MTLCVTRQTETSLTFSFAGFGGLDHELFVAHGATDGGEDKHAWDSFEKVADIAGDQTTYEYEVPAALRDGRPLRFFLMQTLGVNMAKELSYVRSTGQQWVDTGVALSKANSVRTTVDFRFGDPVYVHQTAFFGLQWSGNRYLLNQQSNEFRFHAGGKKVGGLPTPGVDYRFVIDEDKCCHLWTDGVETVTYDDNLRKTDAAGNLAIFGANSGTYLATFSFYRMKICNNNTFQRDFIPALDANGEAGLYDQINNVFYKSKTATPLVAGDERPQSRFGRVMDSTPTFHFSRSVSVAAVTADAVTLAFSNPDGAAYKLCVAYGTADCETRKNDWTSWVEVATIAADATSYIYTLPAALKADGVYYRFFLVKTDNLPYAAELVSITSTGAQGVRLGYIPKASTTIDFRFGSAGTAENTAFFGQSWYGGGNWLLSRQTNFKFYGSGTGAITLDSAFDTSASYRIYIRDDNKAIQSHAGVENRYDITRASNSPLDLTVFSTYPVNVSGATSHRASFRFDSMLVKEGDVVVRDLVPVQTTDGKGALFDQANGDIWTNWTSTDFTKGAAVARQGWVIATSESLVGSASAAPGAVLGGITLSEDTEWSAIDGRLADSGTVDLNGHELHVTDYAAFLAKHATLAGTGALRVTVPANETLTFSAANKPIFTGKLVKDGAGTLVLSSSMTHLTGVTVAEGIMKYGTTSVFSNNGKTIEVLDGAAFDFNGNGNGNAVYYKVAGTGPDGLGALRNTGADCANNQAQMSGLELTADAYIGGSASLGLIHSNYAASTFKLNDFTLTLNLPSGKSFWICNVTTSNAGTILVKSGQAYFHNKESKLPSVDFIVDGANAVFQKPSGGPKCTVRDVTVKNGGAFNEYVNNTYIRNLYVFDGGQVPNTGIAWIYTSGTVLVSNETTDVSIYPPICENGTYPKLVKYGAGTLTLANNYIEEHINLGAEIFGGKVVMESVRGSDAAPEKALSSSAIPVTIHAGATLDMTKCTNTTPFKVTRLVVEDGGTLLHAANNNLSIAGAATYDKPLPFGAFAGSLEIAAAVTFDLTDLYSGASAPAAGADVTLFSAGTLTRASAGIVNIVGCPYDNYVTYESGSVVLHTASAAVAELNPIKIWNLGGTYVYGANNNSYRAQLGTLLAAEGWKVEMTGWRTSSASIICNAKDAWKRHAGIVDLALKTSATRAGLLEGLETYCAAANEPDFTVFLCGDADVADGVADAAVFAHYTNAVTRIKAALPMTTVIACTIPGGSAELNESITNWCATASDVEAVDVSSAITSSQTEAECAAVAAAIKAKLVTLATANGKNTPSTWVRPTVTLGATNNVPAAYLAGFTRVRAIEPTPTLGYANNLYSIPYTYAPAMQETGIAKAGYYVELVRRDTDALQALWVDMDAPGTTWADVALPVTTAQKKRQVVTKLHVWSNFGGVRQVPANDDTVEGFIEFTPLNYSEPDVAVEGSMSDPWTKTYGFSDTFSTSGNHACFQLMRKFAEADGVLPGEILFAYNGWGSTTAGNRAIGMGTMANYGTAGYVTAMSLDWTFVYGADGSDVANLSAPAYSLIRIEFWVKYDETPTRASTANYLWTGATDAAFATVGNWAKDETVATSLANANILLPEGASQSFSYIGYDPISLTTTTLMVDGAATFPTVGGFYLYGLDMGATGRITYDPTKFTFRLVNPPTFASGAIIALTSNYAANTKGRFLLMTWNRGSLDMADADLNALFDAASAAGADVKVWAENFEDGGGRLWLDLDYSAAKERINVFCTGDSITQGSNSTYGNWRIFLMKRLAAAGYAPVAKGHWKIESNDIC